MPLKDKDGKVVMGDDGKPKLGDPMPMPFPQGMGQVITGFDQGFVGMKVGGKRRIFIPWQLAYGTREMPDHGVEHPGIPAKSDLIFDVELVDVSDLPQMPSHPSIGATRQAPPAPPAPGTAPKPPAPPAPTSSAAPAASTAPAQSQPK